MIKHSSKFGELTKDGKIGVLILITTILTLIIITGILLVPKLLAKPTLPDIAKVDINTHIIDVVKSAPNKNTVIPTNTELYPVPTPQPNPFTPSQLLSPIVSSQPLPGTILCGISPFFEIFYASDNIIGDGTPNWTKMPGTLSMIEVNQDGSMYGVNGTVGSIYYCSSYKNPDWKLIAGILIQVSYNGTQLCGVNAAGQIWSASNGIKGIGSPEWAEISGGINARQVVVNSNGSIYLNSKNNQIWYAPDIKTKNTIGNSGVQWKQLPNTTASYITANNTTLMCISSNQLWYANTNIKGDGTPNWTSIPLPSTDFPVTSIILNTDGTMYITLSNNTIWYGIATYNNPGWKQIPGSLRYITSNK
jgi:hypothetical protein